MDSAILGIDISKSKFDVVLLRDKKHKSHCFHNSKKGFAKLIEWLLTFKVDKVHACMEATGFYGDALALFLYENNHDVSIINPFQIKSFGCSQLIRTKTDQKDAFVIAEFCKIFNPKFWKPSAPELQELRNLYRTLKALQQDRQRLKNRLEKHENAGNFILSECKILLSCYEKSMANIETEITKVLSHKNLKKKHDLLKTIPALSSITATAILAELPDINLFKDARQAAAFAGLTPSHKQSGSSVNGKTRLSKIGSPNLRKALYMPAIVAIKHNPIIKEMSERLEKKGKRKMQIVGASMRKLLHIAFGVLKTETTFNMNIGNMQNST